MKQSITNSDKNRRIIYHLIEQGSYKGYVKADEFEIQQNRFACKYRLIGVLNDHGHFDLKFDYILL
uniref:hypothetical protein n=1 Tax=Flavobacterium sp. TaxID=239 RepID=UPI00404AD436